MYDIIIGRNEEDKKKFGNEGTIFIGKQYVKMGQTTSLSNKIFMDVSTSHVVFICGKRGSGKSYTMGVIAEGMSHLPAEVKQNIAVVMLDTMGIYWTMKHPNKKEELLLREWGLESEGLAVQIYTPKGFHTKFKEEGIPTDFPFSLKPSELAASDWCLSFDLDINSEIGVVIERIVNELKEGGKNYSIKDIVGAARQMQEVKSEIKEAIVNRFISADKWGLFDKEGTPIRDLVKGGQVTILDVSCYASIAGASSIRALVIGLVSDKLFLDRMVARKKEEYNSVRQDTSLIDRGIQGKRDPLVWLVIDEAHEFLPNEGKTVATKPLVTILREGRQPGISLILASQQPGKIHTDVLTQADVVIAHRLTANYDIKALGMLMQSYMREGLDKQLNNLPDDKGAAIVFDDNNEKLFPMRVRPRITWHGGSSPVAMSKKKKVFEF
ncbi:ATP-binding protein [Candidatus Woesearchaeota archaeon]|nr:ATP-binding protein [Candidatus Woesearchaeota archaeon]